MIVLGVIILQIDGYLDGFAHVSTEFLFVCPGWMLCF